MVFSVKIIKFVDLDKLIMMNNIKLDKRLI